MSKELLKKHILGAKIISVEVEAQSNIPTFTLDNGAHFQMSARLYGADYDNLTYFNITVEDSNFSIGGYHFGSDSTTESVSSDDNIKKNGDVLIEDLYGAEAFAQLIGCVITRAFRGEYVSIDLDNQKRLSSKCSAYMKFDRYLYTLYQLQD